MGIYLLVLEQEQAAVRGCRGGGGGGGGGGRHMLTWGWSADPNLAGGRERRGEAEEEGNPRRHATGRGWEREGSSAALLKRRRRRRRPVQSGAEARGDRQREGERCTSRFFGPALLRV
jgi:hypothetical protein